MLKDNVERKLIMKMAEIAKEYVEPYDNMDRSPEVQKNAWREVKYDTYKELLLEYWGYKK